MAKHLTAGRYNLSAHDPDVKELFGLDRKAKWPEHGISGRFIQGIMCWVEPLAPAPLGRCHRRFKLRAMCQCPVCAKNMPIGRLAQHSKVHG